MRRRVLVGFLIATLSASSDARAQGGDRCVDGLDDATVARWLSRTETDLRRSARRGRAWMIAWSIVNAGFLGASIAIARTEDDPYVHEAAIWGAVGSGLGVTMLYAPPLATVYGPRRLRRADTPRDRLDAAVRLLRSGAHSERELGAPYWHAVNATYVTGESLVLGFRHRDDGWLVLLNGLASLTITETQLLTTPRVARRAVDRLEADDYPCGAEPAASEGRRVEVRLAGLGVFGRF